MTVDEQTTLKANVLRLHQRKRWTQRELAKEAGIHEDVIGKINRMESISDTSIGRLAFALGVDVEQLFYYDTPSHEKDNKAETLRSGKPALLESPQATNLGAFGFFGHPSGGRPELCILFAHIRQASAFARSTLADFYAPPPLHFYSARVAALRGRQGKTGQPRRGLVSFPSARHEADFQPR